MALTAYRPERPEVIRDTDVEKGIIAAFARHGTAANILMMLMIAAGIWAFFNLRTQFFPDFVQERITVNVSWPDAPAASVDEAIVQVLEPEVRFLENVDSVFASANANAAVFSLLFKTGKRVLGDYDRQLKSGNKAPTFHAEEYADLDLDHESWPASQRNDNH